MHNTRLGHICVIYNCISFKFNSDDTATNGACNMKKIRKHLPWNILHTNIIYICKKSGFRQVCGITFLFFNFNLRDEKTIILRIIKYLYHLAVWYWLEINSKEHFSLSRNIALNIVTLKLQNVVSVLRFQFKSPKNVHPTFSQYLLVLVPPRTKCICPEWEIVH